MMHVPFFIVWMVFAVWMTILFADILNIELTVFAEDGVVTAFASIQAKEVEHRGY
jgi:hypothetical protein